MAHAKQISHRFRPGKIPIRAIVFSAALCLSAGLSGQEAGESARVFAAPEDFRGLKLGMQLDEVKAMLLNDPYFDYHGEPDVSFLPRSFDSLIECAGLSYVRRAYFQFKQKKLYIMTLVFNNDKIDHYSVFTRLSEKYGPFAALTPSKVTWDFDTMVLTLERPLSIKYVDKKTFAELQETGKPEQSLRDVSRERFLENF